VQLLAEKEEVHFLSFSSLPRILYDYASVATKNDLAMLVKEFHFGRPQMTTNRKFRNDANVCRHIVELVDTL
jgi:hypothetical protein